MIIFFNFIIWYRPCRPLKKTDMLSYERLRRLSRRILGPGPLNRKIWGLAYPVFLSMISHTMIMVSDTAMVGRLGPHALAAAGLGGMSLWTLLSILFGGSMGVQIITARRIGEKNKTGAGRALHSAVLLTIALAVILVPAAYLFSGTWMHLIASSPDVEGLALSFYRIRLEGIFLFFLSFIMTGFFDGLGKTRITMYSAVTMAFSNVFFNWIFIYGKLGAPAMGVEGAALSSNLAGGISLLVYVFHLLRKEFRPYAVLRRPIFEMESAKEILYISFPPGLENLLMHSAFLLFYRIAGMIGTTSVASTNILISVMSISFMPGFSFGIAATTLLGQSMGAGKFRLAKQAVFRSAIFSAITMGTMGILFILTGPNLVGLFTDDPKVLAETAIPLVLVALFQTGDAIHMVMSSALRGAGLVYFVMGIYAVVSYFIMLPLGYFLGVVLEFGTAGLWASFCVWLLVLASTFLYKFTRGDWVKGKV